MVTSSGVDSGRASLGSIDLNLLVALDALLRDRSVTRAGRRIGLSKPAMSHALARLREMLGDPVLTREGRAMRRTALGERLAARVQQLLGEAESVLLGHRSFVPATARRTFRVATNDYCAAVLLPQLTETIGRLAPGVDLELHAHRGQAPAEELAGGELDLAVGVFMRVGAGLVIDELFRERFCCLVRRGHPRVGKALTLQRFVELGHLLVTVPDYGPGVVDFALAERKMERRVRVRVPSFLVAPLVVAQTDLILTAPERIARIAARAHRLRILAPPLALPSFSVQLVRRAGSDDAALRWLRGRIVDAAALIASAPAPVTR
jgi:DNA-binding transcriptional LysR family regulator